MVQNRERACLLVIRPWLARRSGWDSSAYAHFDALVMTHPAGSTPRRYGDLCVPIGESDDLPALRRERFRFSCQIDDKRAGAYAWRWGYTPDAGEVFTLRDLERCGRSFAMIGRAMDRAHREDGPAETVGRHVVRLARALRLDGIVLLETSTTGSFEDRLDLARRFGPGEYGDAMGSIDWLVHDLHAACVERGQPVPA